MRQLISGLVAAVAVVIVSAAPALACGGGLFGSCSPCGQAFSPCAAPVYVAPEPIVSTCGCGAAYERLPDPEQEYATAPAHHQYYYADQGPTYSGPGNFAPYRTYREGGWGYRHHPHHYGYTHPHAWRHADHYGYGERHSMHYGAPMGMPRHYGYREHTLRRYN